MSYKNKFIITNKSKTNTNDAFELVLTVIKDAKEQSNIRRCTMLRTDNEAGFITVVYDITKTADKFTIYNGRCRF